jgi:hypothetical protein
MSARLGELLVKAKLITRDQLRNAITAQRKSGGRLGMHLVKGGAISEADLTLPNSTT